MLRLITAPAFDLSRPAAVGARCALLGVISLLLAGCPTEQKQESAYLALNVRENDRLPLAPHVLTIRARPTPAMAAEHVGTALRFMVLDKRTLKIHRLVAPVGQRHPAPWGGALYPMAFVDDLILREGRALHGPEGYFNPAVWVLLEDGNGQPLHEGWLFARDPAQTAWDHPRYDMTFLGVAEGGSKEGVTNLESAGEESGSSGRASSANKKRVPSTPASIPEPQDEGMDTLSDPED